MKIARPRSDMLQRRVIITPKVTNIPNQPPIVLKTEPRVPEMTLDEEYVAFRMLLDPFRELRKVLDSEWLEYVEAITRCGLQIIELMEKSETCLQVDFGSDVAYAAFDKWATKYHLTYEITCEPELYIGPMSESSAPYAIMRAACDDGFQAKRVSAIFTPIVASPASDAEFVVCGFASTEELTNMVKYTVYYNTKRATNDRDFYVNHKKDIAAYRALGFNNTSVSDNWVKTFM